LIRLIAYRLLLMASHRRRWIADEWSGDRACLLGAHADHLVRVLRAEVGQQFEIAAGATVRRGTISRIAPDRVEFELSEEVESTPAPRIAIALSIFKFDRFEWALEKLTELGVTTVIPITASRTDPHLTKAAPKRLDRWKRIALAAAEQSRRAAPPEIEQIRKLGEVLEVPAAVRVVLSEYAAPERGLVAVLRELDPSDGDVLLAFGPEGGWTENELESFRERGWSEASLGTNILRAETAAIAAAAIAMAQLSR
jgi:16S rRNA (uracil1498-N3)-methyltransferase